MGDASGGSRVLIGEHQSLDENGGVWSYLKHEAIRTSRTVCYVSYVLLFPREEKQDIRDVADCRFESLISRRQGLRFGLSNCK